MEHIVQTVTNTLAGHDMATTAALKSLILLPSVKLNHDFRILGRIREVSQAVQKLLSP